MSANLFLISQSNELDIMPVRENPGHQLISIRGAIEAIDFTAVEDGSAPMPETIDAIVRHLAKLYPHGGNQFCAAVEQAVRLAWRARHELQKIREAV